MSLSPPSWGQLVGYRQVVSRVVIYIRNTLIISTTSRHTQICFCHPYIETNLLYQENGAVRKLTDLLAIYCGCGKLTKYHYNHIPRMFTVLAFEICEEKTKQNSFCMQECRSMNLNTLRTRMQLHCVSAGYTFQSVGKASMTNLNQ